MIQQRFSPRKLLGFEDYFWSRVRIRGSKSCWLWDGPVQKSGYVYVTDCRKNSPTKGKQITAHRLAYELVFGPLEYHACHECDVRHCMSPYHLFDGTQTDNMQDCIDKGRFHFSKGIPFKKRKLHPRHVAKISWDTVHYIRGLFAVGYTRKELHLMFLNLKFSHVDAIIYNRSWHEQKL